MTYIGKGDAERYLACSSARRRRGCSSRALFNFNEAERQFLDAAMQMDPAARRTPAASETRGELHRVQRDVARLSGRLTKLLAAFESDSTDEIVATVSATRDRLRLARLAEGRLKDAIVVEEHGAGLPDLLAAISELRSPEHPTSGPSKFLVRARIAHAAKAAGFTAVFHEQQRRVELRCVGYTDAVWFSCLPQRSDPKRDPLGRFAKRSHDG